EEQRLLGRRLEDCDARCVRLRPRLGAEARRAVAELPHPRDPRSAPRVGGDDGDRRRRDGAGGRTADRPRSPRHRSDRPHRQRHAGAGAPRRGLRSLGARHRSARVADRELRVPDGPSHRGRRRVLPDARGGCRLAQTAGAVSADRELAWRSAVVVRRSQLRIQTMRHSSIVASICVAFIAGLGAGPAFAGDKNDDKKTAAVPPAVTEEYRLGAGDKLRIEVYKDAQLSQSVQVRPDGKATLPLIGDPAAVLTPIELRDQIAKSLTEYVTNPTVTVIVVEATASTAYVMGEVNHPGAVNLQAPLTILQALALAGGLKDFADVKNIRVLRPT